MKVRNSRTLARLLTINPFVSESQRAWMYANHPEMAKEWEAHTPKDKKLPKRKHVHNARRSYRRDPTRTTALRLAFVRRLRKQFAALKRRVVELVGEQDSFGLARPPLLANADFQFTSSPDKIVEFQKRLAKDFEATVSGDDAEALWTKYIQEGFKKGANRSYEDVKAKAKAASDKSPDYHKGAKDEFLKSSFNHPETIEKAKLLAGRAFDELEDVTSRMSTLMSRSLTDSLVQGKNPREAAKDLAKQVDIGLTRATLIARTEIIRAHAEGQLLAMDKLGVKSLGVMVEWSTAGDDAVCPECEDMEGQVFSIADAYGMLPLHPNCRCAWIPAVPDEDDDDELTDNRFCATGAGGGVDPSCGSGGALAPKAMRAKAVAVAKAKFKEAPVPTREDRKLASKMLAKLGANKYRRNLVGNTEDRFKRREALLREFGDGTHCPCVYCGVKIGHGTMEQDKIYTTAEGGKYRTPNLVPACSGCNKARGDKPFKSVLGALTANTQVHATGLTYPSIEYDTEPVKVAGLLRTVHVDVLGYDQAWIDGVQVDPETVQLSAVNAFCPTGAGGGVDPTCSPHGGGVGVTQKHFNSLKAKGIKLTKVWMTKIEAINPGWDGKSPLKIPLAMEEQAGKIAAHLGVKVLPVNTAGLYKALKAEGKKPAAIAKAQKEFTSANDGPGVQDAAFDKGAGEHFAAVKSPNAHIADQKAWSEALNYEERMAIGTWKGSADAIRKSVASGMLSDEAEHFIDAVYKAPEYQGQTFRGLKYEGAKQVMAAIAAAGVGGTWTDKAPHCTSRNTDTALSFAKGSLMLHINTLSGGMIESIGGHKGEQEVVGKPGVQYRIDNIVKGQTYKDSSGYTHTVMMRVDLTEIPGTAAKHSDLVKPPVEIVPHGFPKLSELSTVKSLPGSTAPTLAKDKAGKEWVVKKNAGNPDHLQSEQDAGDAYKAMGIATPKSAIVVGKGGTAKVSEYLEGGQTLGKWIVGKDEAEKQAMYKEIGKNFVADAVMANWDVIGQGKDNILIHEGKPVRIDNGGALAYRAQGSPKGAKFGKEVTELQTLRDPAKNSHAAEVFKHLTDTDLKHQAKEVLAKRDAVIAAIANPAVQAIMKERFQYLAEWANK